MDYERQICTPETSTELPPPTFSSLDAQDQYGNEFLNELVCQQPDSASQILGGSPADTSPAPAPPSEEMSIEEYLEIIERVEGHYQGSAEGEYDPNTAVTGLRALYGYDGGGGWEQMIPDAPTVAPPTEEQVPGLDRLFRTDGQGNQTSRLVRLPNGDVMDPGHIYTGIDAVQHPDAHWGMDSYGIENEDGATWSGDVGSALVAWHESRDAAEDRAGWYDAPTGAISVDQAMEANSSVADLHSDLDGVVLGHHFDDSRSLTDQLRSYYTDPDAELSYEHRYSEFMETQGMQVDDTGALDEASQQIVRDEVDDFAELFSRRSEGDLSAGWGIVSSRYDQDDESSTQFSDRFIDYLEQGRRGEPAQ